MTDMEVIADRMFAGLTRKRPPGTHLNTACDGGMPFINAFGAWAFLTMHDSIIHDCRPRMWMDEEADRLSRMKIGDERSEGFRFLDAARGHGPRYFAYHEWAYLPYATAGQFEILGHVAAEQTQRWIAWGSMEPYQLPRVGGPIVERVPATVAAWGNPDLPKRAGARERVLELMNSVPEETRTS